MYSNEKNVQILIALLKKYNISEIIMSPGGSDAPIVQSFQYDHFFHCHSVVDERNSVYYGIGISQVKKCPVVCVCTSGTAVSNFMPGMTEAYYQNIPIIAVTADSPDTVLDQLKLQKISQRTIFSELVKKEVTLPSVISREDERVCNRYVNDALLELNHHGSGPIHINVTISQTLACEIQELPAVKMIRRHTVFDNSIVESVKKRLIGKKILIVVGQGLSITDDFTRFCDGFFERYNCVFSVETISNLRCRGCITTYPITECGAIPDSVSVIPDIVISMGNHIASYNLEGFLKRNSDRIENWLISEVGNVRDPYWCLSDIFEITPASFFRIVTEDDYREEIHKDYSYYNEWERLSDRCEKKIFEFSSFSIADAIIRTIPEKSVLHTAVLNSTRSMQFTEYLDKEINCYCNLGALGIDGCVATFIGEAVSTNELAYLLIGDLSFFYDMNAISIRGLTNNIRIVLLNNGGGEEFKIKMDYPQIEEYVCAQTNRIAKGWAEDCGFDYYYASDTQELCRALDVFKEQSDKPLFLEIKIDIDNDSKLIRELYRRNAIDKESTMSGGLKSIAKRMLPPKYTRKVKEIYRAMKS